MNIFIAPIFRIVDLILQKNKWDALMRFQLGKIGMFQGSLRLSCTHVVQKWIPLRRNAPRGRDITYNINYYQEKV
jgi:hypothetical protein